MSNPFRQTVKVEPSENRYESLGLKKNPFPTEPSLKPSSPDPRDNGTIYSEELHKDKQDKLEKILIPTPENKDPLSIGFLMDLATSRGRGIGKSAFLKYQRDRINNDFGEKASRGTAVMFAVHVMPPPECRKFWEFCRTIVEALIDQEIIGLALCRLRAFSGMIPEEVLKKAGGIRNLIGTIGDDTWLRKENVNYTLTIDRHINDTLRSAGVREEFAQILSYTANVSELNKRIGSAFTNFFWQRDGGRLLFDDLVKLFIKAEFSHGLLFIDEVEKIVYHQNMMEKRAFAESLRYYLMDADLENNKNKFFGMLLTIHPGIQELLIPHWKSAGLDGISPISEPGAQANTIYFSKLDQSMAIPLVKVYLNYYRTNAAIIEGVEPFTKEAVIEALIKSGGVPRPMLLLLNHVVERAAQLKKTEIDKALIDEVYSAREILEVEDKSEDEIPPSVKVDLTKG
jgi:hypothetical protein